MPNRQSPTPALAPGASVVNRESEKDFLFLHIRDLPYFRGFLRAIESRYYQDFDMPSPILDVGCGDGNFASLTFDQTIDVGLDPWHGPIHEAKQYGKYRLLVESDGGRAPFPDNYFSSGFSNSVLEHIPHVQQVLKETARVLKPGAPFYFCVPNTRYLTELSLPRVFGKGYAEWFRKMSRVEHAVEPETWQGWLESAGFALERWWHYFSPAAMRVLEWGHYFGAPTLLPHKLFDRWILSPTRWNLFFTERFLRKYVAFPEHPQGTFTFYVARKR